MRPSGKASHGSLAALVHRRLARRTARSLDRPHPHRSQPFAGQRKRSPRHSPKERSASRHHRRVSRHPSQQDNGTFFFPHTHHDGGPAAPLRVGSTVSLRSNNVRRNEAPFAPLGDGPQKTRPQPNRLTPRDRPANRSGQQHPQRATTNILQQGSSFASERSSRSPFQERSQP